MIKLTHEIAILTNHGQTRQTSQFHHFQGKVNSGLLGEHGTSLKFCYNQKSFETQISSQLDCKVELLMHESQIYQNNPNRSPQTVLTMHS